MPDAETQPQFDQQMLATALATALPRIYVNGFIIVQSLSDILVVSQTNGAASSILNMSFTTAKSFLSDLKRVVEHLESTTGHDIMTMNDIASRQSGPRQ